MKSKLIPIAMLICVSTFSISAVARTTKSTPARQQKALVKRINQGALRVYKAFVRQSGNTLFVDGDLNELFEDLLLAADGLTDSRYLRHNLVIVMQIASEIEQELLANDVSADMMLTWSLLHADLDRLAKLNGIKWTEAVITDQLIATLASDADTISTKVKAELSPLQLISAKSSTDLFVLLSSFRSSAQQLNHSLGKNLHYRIETVRHHARAINASLEKHVISTALQHNWRHVTSRLEELIRLYRLDSIELEHSGTTKVPSIDVSKSCLP